MTDRPEPATVGGFTRPILLASDVVEITRDVDRETWEIRVVAEPVLELTPDLRDVVRVDPAAIGLSVKITRPHNPFADEPDEAIGSERRDRVEALLPVEVARSLWAALGRGLEAADALAVGEAQA